MCFTSDMLGQEGTMANGLNYANVYCVGLVGQ
jgi:hypothetical protein